MVDGISAEVQQFLAAHIRSVTELEVLLFLRDRAARVWTADHVARELYLDRGAAGHMLDDLAARGFLSKGNAGFAYAPADPLRRPLDEVARHYNSRRVTIIGLIFGAT